jgi:hypothetical protein
MIIAGIITIFFWGSLGGFDFIWDTNDCYKYDVIATQCNYYMEHNLNIETYDLWRTSVIQTWEFNQHVGIIGGPFEHIDINAYENMKYLIRTYQQEAGMFSFWSVYF